ncbi:glycosyltransferase family 39 protein [Methylacidimicrobium sp. B4]|uniref:ArnT family glycosyltransferase n=1 Tax=Methylacidimicrobium sp. B4 TaxID=2796139 RepID=UPI001A8C980F|nr:glycosyltransferase family 39 protein [Methylacidimicrobium sp. B4]QSR84107.1 glycosyltransferase family 39 protein [Methylacidimicrobium sp. B4]
MTRLDWAMAAGLVVVALCRLRYAVTLDLLPDEAHYWLWAQHPALSYVTKGPIVAWLIGLGTTLFGDTVLGVRLPSVLLSVGTGWLFYRLGQRLFSSWCGVATAAVAAILPIFAVGSVLMTIDAPSVFFWLLAAAFFWEGRENASGWPWAAAGLAVAAGFAAKFVNWFEPLSFALFLLHSRRARSNLFSSRFLLLLGSAALGLLPFLAWNAAHGGVTVDHLLHRGGLREPFTLQPKEIEQFWIEQALSLSPLVFLALLWAAAVGLRDRSPTAPSLFLATLFFPVFLFYAILSLHQAAKANWTVTGSSAALLVTVAYWGERARRSSWARLLVGSALTLALIETAFLHGLGSGLLGPKNPLLRARGWAEIGREAEGYALLSHPDFWIANDYAVASEIAFYAHRREVFVPNFRREGTQFALWPGYRPTPGSRALYISSETEGIVPTRLLGEFPKARYLGGAWRQWNGQRIEYFRFWLLSGPDGAYNSSVSPGGGTTTSRPGLSSRSRSWNQARAGGSP